MKFFLCFLQSSSLLRPYIGSCRNRNYISNKSSLLFNDYYFSTIRSSKSFVPNQYNRKNYLSNDLILEKRVPIKYGSYPIQRQLNQEQKAKGFLPSSSSLFFFPSPTYYDRSFCSSIKEPQQSRHYYQFEQPKQFHNHPFNFKNSFSSNFSNDTHVINNDHINSSDIFTRNNHSIFDFPSNNMSSLRYSSGINSKTYSYDQRISDQGNKYIIQLKTDDYQENDFIITPHLSQNQLIIDAKHNEEDSSGGFVRRELHKIFLIPKHIDLNKYTYSYNKNTQELTIEMPYLQVNTNETKSDPSLTFSYRDLNLTNEANILPTIDSHHSNIRNEEAQESTNQISKPFDFDLFHRSAFRPQIIQTPSNENKLLMSLDLGDYQPEDIKISIKDQELIVKAERKIQTDTRKSRTSFFQSTTLPPHTDIEHLKSDFTNGKLIIEAPYLDRRNKSNE